MSAIQGVKRLARKALYRSGVGGAYHRVRNGRALTVLMFHRVLPSDHPDFSRAEREFIFTLDGFRRTLDFVQRHYNVVTLRQVSTAQGGGTALPMNPVLITFDDGWRDTVVYALPELNRRGLQALLFVTWDAIGAARQRWWQDALVTAMAHSEARVKLCELAGWDGLTAQEAGVHRRLSSWMASLPSAQRQHLLELAMPGVWGAVTGPQMLGEDELQMWISAGMELGSHGMSHAPMTLCIKAEVELVDSFRMLRNATDLSPSMSFPHGAISPELLHHAYSTGYDYLFTSEAALQAIALGEGIRKKAIGRIHLPENEWTCEFGKISEERLASFLFHRPKN